MPNVVQTKNGFSSASLVDWLVAEKIVENKAMGVALSGEMLKYQFLLQVYPEERSKTPVHNPKLSSVKVNSLNNTTISKFK